ncbi:MAG TPA: hypothetical protein VEP90_06410 [Methylomirabilota bacterium]|nr:hypothetical protein [Methylomirabilota bacterium]
MSLFLHDYTLSEPQKVLGKEIIGHRLWRVIPRQNKLFSAAVPVEWEKNMEEARDLAFTYIMGYHAFKTKEGLLKYYLPTLYGPGTKFIIGTVWMWGEVIEHRFGYRSEYVAIRSLDAYYKAVHVGLGFIVYKEVKWGFRKYFLMKRLRKYYGVENATVDDLERENHPLREEPV